MFTATSKLRKIAGGMIAAEIVKLRCRIFEESYTVTIARRTFPLMTKGKLK